MVTERIKIVREMIKLDPPPFKLHSIAPNHISVCFRLDPRKERRFADGYCMHYTQGYHKIIVWYVLDSPILCFHHVLTHELVHVFSVVDDELFASWSNIEYEKHPSEAYANELADYYIKALWPSTTSIDGRLMLYNPSMAKLLENEWRKVYGTDQQVWCSTILLQLWGSLY